MTSKEITKIMNMVRDLLNHEMAFHQFAKILTEEMQE